jgi:phospholipase C
MAMLSAERPEQTVNDGVLTEGAKPGCTKPACTALVPTVPSLQWSQPVHLQRPDSTFVTQLIATAEQAPQTRALRRATLADAQSAYSANRPRTVGAGIRTRQII